MNANLRSILTERNLESHLNIYRLKYDEYSLVVSVKKSQRKELLEKINLISQQHVLVGMRLLNGVPEVCLLSSSYKKVYDIERGGIKLKQYQPFDSTKERNKQGFILALKKMLSQYTT